MHTGAYQKTFIGRLPVNYPNKVTRRLAGVKPY
jgi:hypothetical protein